MEQTNDKSTLGGFRYDFSFLYYISIWPALYYNGNVLIVQ